MKFLLSSIFILLIITKIALAQEPKSIHQLQYEFYDEHPELIGKEFIQLYKQDPSLLKPKSLSKVIYGFHPYWLSDATASQYYYSLLTHIAYFSAEVDNSISTTGGFSTTHSWSSTQVVNYAQSCGLKVHLTIVMFSNHSNVLANSTYRQNLINNILAQVNLRNADGVNIDFEGITSSQAANFRTFVFDLGTSLKAISKELVVCIPSVDWSSVFTSTFFSTVNSVVDYYFLMSYGYFYSGSTTAGPVAPLTGRTYCVENSVSSYINAGAGSSRLILGSPYYGIDWPVTNSDRMSATTGTGSSIFYSSAKTKLASIPETDKFYDATYRVPWYRYQDGSQWRQVWYEDDISLKEKYDLINSQMLAGPGIWALGYDGTNTELWEALKNKFASSPDPTHTSLEDFEGSVGGFDRQPTFSGSTVGISATSSSDWSANFANNGYGSLNVSLIDEPSSSSNWTVRLLSGTGVPANNITLNSTGYIGLWIKTINAPTSAQIAVTIDDGAGGTELSSKQNITNDGEWHLYQWDFSGSGWINFSGGNGVINGPTVTLDAIMLYAPNASPEWVLYIDDVSYDPAGPLPVELTTFTASVIGSRVKLSWQTATEINNYGFEVERCALSAERQAWENIGFISGNGNSNSQKSYSFMDENISVGKYSYRLKQIDNDGTFEFSSTIEVDLGIPKDFQLSQNYPNPFNPMTKIQYTLPVDAQVTLQIYSITGELMESLVSEYQTSGSYTIDFDGSNFASGTYLYRLVANDFVQARKMTLVK
ncbi:MAG: T9SS type A sorting domain-containing protein [Bacteroidia bacterium]|nr:T9SS type A sorting domain-containing protein [Bacteroidia bacterium]